MLPLVSIIIPVYNCELFLKRALERVLQQTYPNLEIIVVDDESSDNSYSIAKQFETRAVKVFRQKNAGAAVARNTGLKNANGDFIQFLDADDYLSPGKIEEQVKALDGQQDKVAVCNYTSFVNDEELLQQRPLVDQSAFIFSTDNPAGFLVNLWGGNNGKSNFIQTNCWLIPRTLIDEAGGWRPYRCPDDDGEFFARVLLASKGIIYVPGVMNYYRRENTEHKLSSNSKNKYVQNTLLTIDLKYKYLEEKYNDEKLDKAFAKQYLDFAVHQYPQQKILSQLAMRKYLKIGQRATLPLLGGRTIEIIKKLFGWRVARIIKYRIR